MEILTPNQIKAADAIIYDEVGAGTTSPPRIIAKSNENGWGLSDNDISTAASFLETHNFITIWDAKGDLNYRLDPKGVQYKESGNSISDYMNEIAVKEANRLQKDERDEEIKVLQLQDYRDKVHDLNPAQSSVLRGTWERHKQSLLMVLIGVLITATVTIIVKIWGH
jgi:hypothetical protein